MNSTPTYMQFRLFLRGAGCEESFDRAFYDNNDCTLFDEQMWLAVEDYRWIFLRCFRWKQTLEGDSFWRKIDSIWQQICDITEAKQRGNKVEL